MLNNAILVVARILRSLLGNVQQLILGAPSPCGLNPLQETSTASVLPAILHGLLARARQRLTKKPARSDMACSCLLRATTSASCWRADAQPASLSRCRKQRRQRSSGRGAPPHTRAELQSRPISTDLRPQWRYTHGRNPDRIVCGALLGGASASSLPNDLGFLFLFAGPGGLAVGMAWWLAKRETPFPAMTKGELRESINESPAEEPTAEEEIGDDKTTEYDLGTWVSLPTGPVAKTTMQRVLIPSRPAEEGSTLVTVSLQRPLGILLEQVGTGGRTSTVVSGVADGSNAFKQARLAKLTGQGSYIKEGDVLRAATTLQILYPARAIAGAGAPVRTWVPFAADGLRLDEVTERLQRGTAGDGPVHLVFERLQQD